MQLLCLTNEYPPYVRTGAGVHVEYLTRELAQSIAVDVRCFGDQHFTQGNLRVQGLPFDEQAVRAPTPLHPVFGATRRCWDVAAAGVDADLVHCHTWHTLWGGILAKWLYGVPFVMTVHSLERMSPWNRERFGGGYDFACWVERSALEMADAVIAVSQSTKHDVQRLFRVPEDRVQVIYNGVDPTEFRKQVSMEALRRYGIDCSVPYLLYVGRLARQKGLPYLLQAMAYLDPEYQVVLCAGQPDTPALAAEIRRAVEQVAAHREGVIWIQQRVEKAELIELYSHAAALCCPSLYEPFGLVIVEAMACETPVVATAVGGIPEIVVDGETGMLVAVEQMSEAPYAPRDQDRFAQDLAEAINHLMADAVLRERMGQAGRRRIEELFTWSRIADETIGLYEHVLEHA
ncbi:MAG: glycogen synthase [Nitrospirae bacterium]|nr:MAG: glycogen synthase [Nitrospirota bacterium]